jgi:hypothetical protein
VLKITSQQGREEEGRKEGLGGNRAKEKEKVLV